MAPPIKIIGLCGSLRPGSYAAKALKIALESARQAGAEVEYFDQVENPLPFCDGHHLDENDANAVELRALIKAADGVILATPEYHGSCSGVMKNTLDLLSFNEMEGKVCGLVSVLGGQGSSNALNHLRIICRWVHAWVVPHQAAIGASYQAFAEDGSLKDEKLQQRVERVGVDVVKYAHMLRANPELVEFDGDE
ncbi:NAD(P)H-dependent oxidoreductase [bacterium]|nr:NAD(P)H-dependent oxidoreductase [bacterium]